MINLNLILIIFSPFTALIPALIAVLTALRKKMVFWMNPLNLIILLLFGWSLLSGLYNHSIRDMLVSFGFLLYLGVAVFLQNRYNTSGAIETLLGHVWRLSLVTAFVGLLEKLMSYFFDMTWVSNLFWSPTYIPTREAYRIYSTFGNPNVAGDWFAALFIIGLYFVRKTKGTSKIGYIMGTLLFLIAAFMTGSKGAAIGLELGILVYAFLCNSKRGKFIFILTSASLLLLALIFPEMNHATNSRSELWLESFSLAKYKPLFGWGLLGFYAQTGEIHSHNLWLAITTMLGFGGLLGMLALMVHLFRVTLLLYKAGNKLVPMLASLMTLLFGHGLVDFTMLTPQGGMLFFAVAGCMSALALEHEVYYSLDTTSLNTLFTDLNWLINKRPNRLVDPPQLMIKSNISNRYISTTPNRNI